MKIGYRTAGLKDMKWKESFSILNEIGYNFVEICLEESEVLKGEKDKVEEVKSLLKENNLKASISYHGDKVPLAKKIENTYKAIDFAGKLSVDTVIINSETVEPGKEKEQFRDLVSRYQNFCKYAGEKNIKLAVEPEPDLVIHGLKETLQLLEEVNSPYLGVNLDIGHAYITDNDLNKVINELQDSLIYTHLEDISGKVHQHLLPGEGDINFEELIKSLEDIEYEGPLVFDLFGMEENQIEYAKKAYSYINTII